MNDPCPLCGLPDPESNPYCFCPSGEKGTGAMSEHPGKRLARMVNESSLAFMGAEGVQLIASYVSDLEARLEKAEAERELFAAQLQGSDGEVIRSAAANLEAQIKLRTARNDALEEAAEVAERWRKTSAVGEFFEHILDRLPGSIRAIKDKS